MILAAFGAVMAWAAASLPIGGPESPSHPGRGAPEAREGWGAAPRREAAPREAAPRESEPLDTDPNGKEVTTTFDVLGRPKETWAEQTSGVDRWIVTDTEQDVRGLARRESEPRVEALPAAFPPATFQRGGNLRTSVVDAAGVEVWSWHLHRGEATTDHPEPRTTRQLLADNYERKEVGDTLGRLIEVKQGFQGSAASTGVYTCDGRDRVKTFTDGAGGLQCW